MAKKSETKKIPKQVRKTKSAAKKKVAKKSVKKVSKKVAKKSTKKAVNTKESEKKLLVCADEYHCFWTADGYIIADLQQLALALSQMSEKTFLHHVTKEKNDFANWVETVLLDEECAAALRRSKKPNTAHKVVIRHLKFYI